MFLIGLPEKTGIVEAGAQHAFMPVTDDAGGIAVGVQHGQKVRREAAARVLDGKIFLMVAHDRDQNLFRQFEKLGVEGAENRRGPFGQVHYAVEQRFIFTPARARNGASGGVESLTNLFFPGLAAQNPGPLQNLYIRSARPRDLDRPVGQNPMPARLVGQRGLRRIPKG